VLVRIFTDVPVDELGEVVPRVWAELRPSTDEVMFARHGVMLENTADAANVGPDVVKSIAALKMDRQGRYRLLDGEGTTGYAVGEESGSSTKTLDSNFSFRDLFPKEKVTICPLSEVNVPPPPPPEVPIDVVVYQKAGARYRPATAVRLNIGVSSSEWLAEMVGPLAGFNRLSPNILTPSQAGIPQTGSYTPAAVGVTLKSG